MSAFITLLIYFGTLVILLFSGIPIIFVMGILAVASIYIGGTTTWLNALPYIGWTSMTSFTIVAIPLFVLMGYLLLEAGVSTRIYDAFTPLLDRLIPGGLLHANIVIGAIFAACTGSSSASAAAIGAVALPELKKRRYPIGITVGSISAGGTLGVIIPPSVTLIVYGAITMTSVGKLFIGGILPGLFLASMYLLYIVIRLKVQPQLLDGIQKTEKQPLSVCLRNTLSAWPVIIIVVSVLVSIYAGVATPTEAAALGVFASFLLGICYRQMNFEVIKKTIRQTVNTSAMLLGITWVANLMSIFLSNSGLTREVASFVVNSGLSPTTILIIIMAFYIMLGMVMDGLAAMIMILPIIFPIVTGLGFDPVWFGVVLVMICCLAHITPPVGMIIFIMQGLNPDRSYKEIIGGILPFTAVMILTIFTLVAFPGIVTYLPSLM